MAYTHWHIKYAITKKSSQTVYSGRSFGRLPRFLVRIKNAEIRAYPIIADKTSCLRI